MVVLGSLLLVVGVALLLLLWCGVVFPFTLGCFPIDGTDSHLLLLRIHKQK